MKTVLHQEKAFFIHVFGLGVILYNCILNSQKKNKINWGSYQTGRMKVWSQPTEVNICSFLFTVHDICSAKCCDMFCSYICVGNNIQFFKYALYSEEAYFLVPGWLKGFLTKYLMLVGRKILYIILAYASPELHLWKNSCIHIFFFLLFFLTWIHGG